MSPVSPAEFFGESHPVRNKVVEIFVGGLIGKVVGDIVGINGFAGAAVGAWVTGPVLEFVRFSPSEFSQVRAQRKAGRATRQMQTAPLVRLIARLLLNAILVLAGIAAVLLVLGLVTVRPQDIGLGNHEVSQSSFYLVVIGWAVGVSAAVLGLLTAAALDVRDGKGRRGALGFAALAGDFVIVLIGRSVVDGGPDNVYAEALTVLAVRPAAFVWNPIRCARWRWFPGDSRVLTLLSDVRRATPTSRTTYARRAQSGPSEPDVADV